ncbi:hypothetical protein L1887_24577 [Cichorium endivia]|nr:hypothetical protein L1887_24577 [Cichorium endivia]
MGFRVNTKFSIITNVNHKNSSFTPKKPTPTQRKLPESLLPSTPISLLLTHTHTHTEIKSLRLHGAIKAGFWCFSPSTLCEAITYYIPTCSLYRYIFVAHKSQLKLFASFLISHTNQLEIPIFNQSLNRRQTKEQRRRLWVFWGFL